MILYAVALAVFLLIAAFLRHPTPTWQDLKNTPWWAYVGGALGGVAVYAMMTATDEIGAGPFNAIIVTATIVTAVLMDHFGWVGVKQHDFNLWRGIGCALMIGGLLFIAKF